MPRFKNRQQGNSNWYPKVIILYLKVVILYLVAWQPAADAFPARLFAGSPRVLHARYKIVTFAEFRIIGLYLCGIRVASLL